MARNGNGNGNGDRGGGSNPNPRGREQADDCSLAVQFNGNLANFDNEPPVYNDTPARKKSYSWNRGETGNAT